jgi:putative ABC transport system substrate-binding protein
MAGQQPASTTTSVERRADALLVASDPFFFGRREQLGYAGSTSSIARRLLFARVCHRWRADEHGASISDAYRQTGIYTGKILKGAQAADLPVMQPTKFELVINLKTARALNLAVPLTLQASADEVIE